MNQALLAREAAAERGALDPKPEPHVIISGPTRLVRVINEEDEIWLDPYTGQRIEPEKEAE